MGEVGSRRTLLITLVACLLVVVAGVAVAISSSAGGGNAHQANGAAGHAAAGGTPATRPAAPPQVAASAGIAKGALRWPPRLKRPILHWRAGPGGAALSAVTQQMGYAMQAAGVKLYVSMRASCVRLASDIRTAQASPPIPDGAMQRVYAKALAGLSGAAADCRQAISARPNGDESLSVRVNKVQLTRAQAGFTLAAKRIYKATAEIQALARR